MPAVRSADGLRRAARVRAILQPAVFSAGQKLALLTLNAWPLVHVAVAICWTILPPWSLAARIAVAVLWIFLLPPLACRVIVGRGLPRGTIHVPSPAFFRWWTTWQLQMLFNRIALIEEMLRLIPGFYSGWLRLWGARIGRLTLWSPGVRVYDRTLLEIGDDVVIGLDVRITGHFADVDADGRSNLTLGSVSIGQRTTVGGGALLGPGVTLEADQFTEALFLGTPFSRWRAGARVHDHEPG